MENEEYLRILSFYAEGKPYPPLPIYDLPETCYFLYQLSRFDPLNVPPASCYLWKPHEVDKISNPVHEKNTSYLYCKQ